MKSISDDDLCSNCINCAYVPAIGLSDCAYAFPGATDEDGYVTSCFEFTPKDETGTPA